MNRKVERLKEIYASLPTIACKRLCADSCGPTGMGRIEQDRIVAARGGRPIGQVKPPSIICPLLDSQNNCTVYRVRPLLCRLWGIAENLPCNYGCVPEPRYLTAEEGYALMGEVIMVLSDGEDFATADRAIIHQMAEAHRSGRTLL